MKTKIPDEDDPDESIVRGGGRRYAVRVEISVDAASEHNFWSDASKDVADGGVFMATHQVFRIGTVVEVGIRINGDARLTSCTGVVQWTRDHHGGIEDSVGVGIKFLDLPDQVRDVFRNFAQTVRDPIVHEAAEAPSRRRRTTPTTDAPVEPARSSDAPGGSDRRSADSAEAVTAPGPRPRRKR